MKILVERTRTTATLEPGKPLKWSHWNDIIPTGNNRCVVFNTLSQNAVLVDQAVSQSEVVSLPETAKNTLYQLGLIVGESRDEMAEQAERYQYGKQDLSYLDLTILVTHNCQMRCIYCFEGAKENVTLNDSTADAIIQMLERYVHVCRRLRVTWFGGEPLLAYPQMKSLSHKLIDFCDGHHIAYSADITTNGFAITSRRCREMVNDMKIRRFIITIDGTAEVHDKRRPLATGHPTFLKIWDNIRDLVDSGAWVTLRMTIDRKNRSNIPDFLKMLASSRLKGKVGLSFCRTIDIHCTPDDVKNQLYNDEEWAKEEWELIQAAHNLGLWTYSFPHAAPSGGCLRIGDITIAANGVIYKCLDTVGDQRWVCGSVTESPTSSHPDWYRQWLEWSPMSDAMCRPCVLQPLCNGGCPHNALYNEKKHGTSLQCPDWKANYRNQIIEIAKAYESEEL